MNTIWQGIGIVGFWLCWPLLWLSLRFTTRSRVVIISPDNQVLLVKGWLGSGKWILPGGGLGRQEESKAGAIREIHEETGLELKPEQLDLREVGTAKEHGLKFGYQLFVVRLDNTPALKHHSLEITDITWAPINDVHDLSPFTVKLLSPWTNP